MQKKLRKNAPDVMLDRAIFVSQKKKKKRIGPVLATISIVIGMKPGPFMA